MAIKFDRTISLGNVISLVVLLGSMITAVMHINDRLTSLEIKIQPVWERFVGGQR